MGIHQKGTQTMRKKELENKIVVLTQQVRYLTQYINYREELTKYNNIPNTAKPYVNKPLPPYKHLNEFNLKARTRVFYQHTGRDLGDTK